MMAFPMDAPGTPMSFAGIIHIALASVESLGSMLAIGLAALGWRAAGDFRMARTSMLLLGVVFVSGAAAALAQANGTFYLGAVERITIGTYELWMFITALATLRAGQAKAHPA